MNLSGNSTARLPPLPAAVAGAAQRLAPAMEQRRAGSLVVKGAVYSVGRRAILEGIDIELRPGELMAIVGPNGAGKTTLLRTLGGLIVPSSGTVSLDGEPLHRVDGDSRARAIAYVPQNTWIEFAFTATDMAWMGRYPHRRGDAASPAEARAAVHAAMAAADIAALAARPVTEMSAGERQRAVIARALAQRPRFLLLDEPMSALDVRHQFELTAVLHALRDAGMSVVCVLHDLAHAVKYFDRVVVMREGRIVGAGTKEVPLSPDLVAQVFGVALDDVSGEPVIRPLQP